MCSDFGVVYNSIHKLLSIATNLLATNTIVVLLTLNTNTVIQSYYSEY